MVAKPSGHKNKHVLGIAARWSLNAMWKLGVNVLSFLSFPFQNWLNFLNFGIGREISVLPKSKQATKTQTISMKSHILYALAMAKAMAKTLL